MFISNNEVLKKHSISENVSNTYIGHTLTLISTYNKNVWTYGNKSVSQNLTASFVHFQYISGKRSKTLSHITLSQLHFHTKSVTFTFTHFKIRAWFCVKTLTVNISCQK